MASSSELSRLAAAFNAGRTPQQASEIGKLLGIELRVVPEGVLPAGVQAVMLNPAKPKQSVVLRSDSVPVPSHLAPKPDTLIELG